MHILPLAATFLQSYANIKHASFTTKEAFKICPIPTIKELLQWFASSDEIFWEIAYWEIERCSASSVKLLQSTAVT